MEQTVIASCYDKNLIGFFFFWRAGILAGDKSGDFDVHSMHTLILRSINSQEAKVIGSGNVSGRKTNY